VHVKVKRAIHRLRCKRMHWYGYPSYLTDRHGHWLG